MAVALSRVTPAVVQRLRYRFRYCSTRDCLFCGISCRLAASAAACQPGGDGVDADAHSLPRYPLSWVRAARWLLAEMLLFFVPAVVAVVNYAQLLMVDGWRIFAVIALSTLMVLGATAGGGQGLSLRDPQAKHD